jgi:hypothetical protein
MSWGVVMGYKKHILFVSMAIVIVLSFFVFGDTQKTPPTFLNIENQKPNISNIELNDNVSGDDDIVLRADNYTILWCSAQAYDLDGFEDLVASRARIWHSSMSTYDSADDPRWHYTNDSCNITEVTGTPNIIANLNCTFSVLFYANYSEWNCTISINDTFGSKVNGSDNATMLPLLGIDIVNSSIDWGIRAIDTPYDADLELVVENTGNVPIDLQIDAYNDTSIGFPANHSFTCQTGNIATDGIVFNESSGGAYAGSTKLNNDTYINVTSFDLYSQASGTSHTNKSAYFGIFVPSFPTINGTCNGFLRFDALDGR